MNESTEKKLIKHRLSALQLAEALGNVTEACKRRGISKDSSMNPRESSRLMGSRDWMVQYLHELQSELNLNHALILFN